MRRVDLQAITSDRHYNRLARGFRQHTASIRRRAILGTFTRWYAEAKPEGPIIAAEVGVKYGSLTHCIATYCPFIDKIVAIDPYLEYPEGHPDRAQFGYAKRNQPSWEQLYRSAKKILGKLGDRCELRRTTSLAAAAAWEGPLHIAYLDAMHSYDAVLADCKMWWDLVLPGGLLCGDDYYGPDNWRRKTTGVSDAVDAFAASIDRKVLGLHRGWFIQK